MPIGNRYEQAREANANGGVDLEIDPAVGWMSDLGANDF
jgi:hypothetical protein